MSFPTKADREICWSARDRYWQCLDANNVGPDDPVPQTCFETKKIFESSCPPQWVKHFNRRRDYNIYKKNIQTNNFQLPPKDVNLSSNVPSSSSRKQKPFKQIVV